MTPLDVLSQAVGECQRFRYIPDPQREGREIDYWETPAEVEAKGGADCDGLSVWTIAHAYKLGWESNQRLTLRLVVGTVQVDMQARGHAWVELEDGDQRWWGDPTWFEGPWPIQQFTGRQPLYAFTYDGLLFSEKRAYTRG